MSKPAIGLNCDLRLRTATRRQKLEIYREYTDAIERAGGVPVLLPTVEDPALVDSQLDLVGGLVLIGGSDYSPKLYGAKKHCRTRTVHPAREFYDLELARAAIRRGLPILGICGGHQLINIVCGGDLIQHLPDVVAPGSPHASELDDFTHEVVIGPDTALARILAAERLTVNSSHHQAVGQVGSGLIASAHSSDGVIEAIETKGDTFLICVQWHPERLAASSTEHLALFRALVAASIEQAEVA